MLPANVFVQSTAAQPYMVTVDGPNDRFEVVTKSNVDAAVRRSKHATQTGERIATPRIQSSASFRVSAVRAGFPCLYCISPSTDWLVGGWSRRKA